MKKLIFLVLMIISCTISYSNVDEMKNTEANEQIEIERNYYKEVGIKKFYKNLNLKKELDYKIFKMAMNGYEKIRGKNGNNIIIIDFSKDSTEKRFYFIDLKNGRIRYKTYVTHGKNSGAEKAVSFSNHPNSYKSSLGFFLTRNHYKGAYGYSIRLKGLEEEFNSNAIIRGIVIHGSKEAEKKYIETYGFLGRTEGCPALPLSISKEIMEQIPDNTVLFIYGEEEKYFKKSKFLK